MMGLETLIAVNNDIARQAARRRLKPYVPSGAKEVDGWRNLPFEFPNIGYLEPKGWEKVESWFVDKYGHGLESEPAMTHRRLKQVLRDYIETNPDHGFAVVEEGEFQVVVAAFKPVEKK
ncbi:hypothetical protein ETAA8_46620 [Anatilimnocola aggregata]|uniref:Uncharacterized protein n=1 Tax=Anatilimnocola aggregata TaxID=2528021 RepID=A0A517YH60_9BACT|nr:hypothetical protein [Anatilimnocola aggregata]QDU29548.1 hypothetical protein ETAA8_46620 [Anatilimnocola aggregata]